MRDKHVVGDPESLTALRPFDPIDSESAEYYDEIGKDEAYWIKQHEQDDGNYDYPDDREE